MTSDDEKRKRAVEIFVDDIRMAIPRHEKILKEWSEKLLEDPAYHMGWSMKAFDSAAKLLVYNEVVRQVVVLMSREGQSLDIVQAVQMIRREALRETLRYARFPERSTSPVKNLMAECTASVWAEFLESSEWCLA